MTRVKSKVYRFYKMQGMLPDFLIIGTMKGGTTSLYNYLVQHPNVLPAKKKEIHFFDWSFKKGVSYYRSQFPLEIHKHLIRSITRNRMVSGEASPYYLFHPHVARRVALTIPHVKLIVILRNPIDRAYSHYWHWARESIETLSFEAAVRAEPARLEGELEKMISDEYYESYNYGYYSYLSRGRYIDQLKNWESHFSRDRILILCSEELFANPAATFKSVTDFLELPVWKPGSYKPHNSGTYPEMPIKTREFLKRYFTPFNQRLYEHVGRDFGWDE